MWANELAPEA
ncbi:Protein of unknown function [Leuconostoc citreum LBAE C10]|nr:Protein of unknown function [Leuconostoc citreum LBAE C10]